MTQLKQTNGASNTVLINYKIQEPIGNFIPTTAGKAAALNPAGEAAKTAADGS